MKKSKATLKNSANVHPRTKHKNVEAKEMSRENLENKMF